MAFDQRCYDLAEVFLTGSPELDYELNRRRLAQAIQDAIENTLPDLKRILKLEHPPRKKVADREEP